jgi:hypothetical protein
MDFRACWDMVGRRAAEECNESEIHGVQLNETSSRASIDLTACTMSLKQTSMME